MAKNTLPVNFQDDILNSAMGGKRRYRVINNSDGTISLEDATTYDQVGSNFGAAQLNATNEAVNAAADAGKIIDDIDAINNVTQEGYIAGARALKQVNNSLEEHPQFVYDENGQITGYTTKIGGADTVFPFKRGGYIDVLAYRYYNASPSYDYVILDVSNSSKLKIASIVRETYVTLYYVRVFDENNTKLIDITSAGSNFEVDVSNANKVTIQVSGTGNNDNLNKYIYLKGIEW